MDLNPGSKIRDYDIIRLMGSGGMGEVWLAHEAMLNRDVAIKRLNSQFTPDAEFATRFQNEARIQARLKHPNIVGLLTFFTEGDEYFMVLEYAPGITLRELIDRTGPIPEKRSLMIFNQIAAALGHAHAKGIIHRDVKPSNIMVDPQNGDHVLMMDFGIARLMAEGHLTRTGTRLGTMHYMSPEQVLASGDVDHRSDVYSAGVVLYEMLSGRLPYDADTGSDYLIQDKIVREDVPDPREVYPHIGAGTVELLRALTRKEKSERVSLDEVFRADGAEIPPSPKPWGKPVVKEVPEADLGTAPTSVSHRHNPLKKAWLAAVLVLLVGVVAWQLIPRIFVRKSDKPEPQVVGLLRGNMVQVPGGTFMMGSHSGHDDEQPARQVTVSSFWIGKYEVTQAEWKAVMGSNRSVHGGDNLPMDKVSWYDAVKYCNLRSLAEGLTPVYGISGATDPNYWGPAPKVRNGEWDAVICDWGANGYRLPSEAEWEYAAGGGVKSGIHTYSGSNDIHQVGWHASNANKASHPVGSLSPNGLGLHDMSGNLWEWCFDWYAPSYYQYAGSLDPVNSSGSGKRVVRGGCWVDEAFKCTVTKRSSIAPSVGGGYIGFRVCRTNV